MAETFDVASRLAEGRPAVDDIQNYVWACHVLGYQHPDLTLHASQVSDWYGSEDGLDLRALDADCAALEMAVAATEEAMARQDDQLAAVPAAWQGRGAEESREFLRRHGEASSAAAAAVRTAADALTALRDRLWRAVDGKVAAALTIDQRTQAQSADWLAAAHTVTTGAGDRPAASELIDQQVKPFVENDIGGEWLTAMRTATASVADAYDAAIAELTAEPDVMFDVPGDLGPSWTPPIRDDVASTPVAAVGNPASDAGAPPVWSPPSAAIPMPSPAAAPPPPPLPPSAPPIDSAPTAPTMAAPPMPSLGGMGGGLPDVGGGLSSFGQQLADTLGGLFRASGDGLPDSTALDPPELDEPSGVDEDVDDKPDDETAEDDADIEEDPAAQTAEACEEPPAEVPPPVEPPPVEPPPVEPPPPPAEPAPTPAPVTPLPEPPPPPSPAAATGTPCEIAADELPQVGE